MSDRDLNWKYAEDFAQETAAIASARQHSLEQGVEPVSPGVGAQLAVLAAAAGVRTIAEIGTGLGVSALWMLQGAPEATLTSIDSELDFQQTARHALGEAGHAPARTRLITGRALEVLPRMNDGAYDLVLVDADPGNVLAYAEHALRLARPGGIVAIPHALWRGRVADPAQRDATIGGFRDLLDTVRDSAVTASLGMPGDGLLQIVKRDADPAGAS
ncbi:O-methyltransferase [Homoserinibacter sp. YIM 151385]|uniref:O-methyltransferase n=1 Tax=Homoserinibacter sp. YIM 151385 TaxID=2985506 RepID=UPI0022F03F34|nr:class I SAM-dependent methyltransferase [Homoserinibacter sp. YIM 151385]WBU38135.1 class I SAM-dependent methyltransferase [Homoserinibacter sp. YIM 151385]